MSIDEVVGRFESTYIKLDAVITRWMSKYGQPALRWALAIVFVWFGLLKPLRLSPAEDLLFATVAWIPVFGPKAWLIMIGWWEVAIGICFLFRRTTRLAVALLAIQMGGTFLPLVMLPDVTFQAAGKPLVPTLEGQYIIKNLVIIAAAIAIGGSVKSEPFRRKKRNLTPDS
ncbi:MAG: DoxX family protein [Verrucomicrobiota bacterium]